MVTIILYLVMAIISFCFGRSFEKAKVLAHANTNTRYQFTHEGKTRTIQIKEIK